MKNSAKKSISRRKFLANSALAGFAFHFVPSRLLGADAPSNRLNIAGIGVGGMGVGVAVGGTGVVVTGGGMGVAVGPQAATTRLKIATVQ